MSERAFCSKVLGIRIKKEDYWRYHILKEMVERIISFQRKKGFSSDWDALRSWAAQVDVTDVKKDLIGGISRVNLATVQNLRLVCGVDTIKPDVHFKKGLKEIGLANEVQIAELLSELTGYSPLEIDQVFWHWDKYARKREAGNAE